MPSVALPYCARALSGSTALLAGLLGLGCSSDLKGTGVPNGSGATAGSAATGSGGGSSVGGGSGANSKGGSSGTATGGTGTGGAAGSSGTAGGTSGSSGTSGNTACVGSPVVTAKRVVRLTDYQLFKSYASLFGDAAAATITADESAPNPFEREFPPVAGDVSVSANLFGLYDRLAQEAMTYVKANAGTLTKCGATPTDMTCVKNYVLSFAEKAYRHPLSTEESAALTGQFWTDLTGAGVTAADALGFGVYAVLSAPSFVYRTELGSDIAADGPLTPYELATAVSMFLTDRPPDTELLAAAAGGGLSTADQVRAQATRILASAEAHENLDVAILRYFKLTNTPNVALNPETVPGLQVSGGLLSSMFHEGELFMKNVLWTGSLDELLMSRKTWTNQAVATQIYKIDAPKTVDADGFGVVDLPADRAGLMTLATFLTAGSRSTGESPVARGLAVNASILCQVNPVFPTVVDPDTGMMVTDPTVAAAIEALADKSELEKAQFRAKTAKCVGCHSQFDAFGMVLEPFDAVGRSRTMDLAGRTIDSTWTTTTLPDSAGGSMVASAVETANALVASRALDRCMAMNFMNFALAEISKGGANNTNLSAGEQTDSCAVQNLIDSFETTDRSFSSLMVEIAASTTLGTRSKGQ
jgi:hypothetical protein